MERARCVRGPLPSHLPAGRHRPLFSCVRGRGCLHCQAQLRGRCWVSPTPPGAGDVTPQGLAPGGRRL